MSGTRHPTRCASWHLGGFNEQPGNTLPDEQSRDCPKKCGGGIEYGYGLAGGGMGVYQYCSNEECDYWHKTQDPPED